MCTITLLRERDSVLLTMNRDEARFRAPEISPHIHETSQGRWLGPLDSQAGGTWIGVNARGVCAAILNAYLPDEPLLPPPGSPSRGHIIPKILSMGPLIEGRKWLEKAFDPSPYYGFTLVLASITEAFQICWPTKDTLEVLPLEDPISMTSSSGWNTEEVLKWRQEAFRIWIERGAKLRQGVPTYHVEREESLKEYTPLMDRPFSSTRSITQISMSNSAPAAAMRYWKVKSGSVVMEHPDSELKLSLL